MKKNNLKFTAVSDKELLDKTIFYLSTLRPSLPSLRLKDHCSGAIASIFELVSFLDLNKLSDYGNNK